PADRDHCLQYITAIALMKGSIVAEDYEDEVAKDPMIDRLRDKMIVKEDKQYTKDYLDPDKRSIANAVQVTFNDGTTTDNIEFEYPLGHRFRREEAFPQIVDKFKANLATQFAGTQRNTIEDVCLNAQELSTMHVNKFM